MWSYMLARIVSSLNPLVSVTLIVYAIAKLTGDIPLFSP